MGFASDVGKTLGGLLGVTTDNADAKRRALDELLRSGALKDAADLGLYNGGTGSRVAGQLTDGAKAPVSVDPSALDASTAKLEAAKEHYLDQFRNGGLQGQAAIAAAAQASGLMSAGGGQGVRDQIIASAQRQGQVADIAQAERSAAGAQATGIDASNAAAALQKALFAAQVTHANLQANLERQNTLFGLQNTQDNLSNQVEAATNDARNSADSTGIDMQSYQAKIGNEIMSMISSGLAKGAGTATSAFGGAAPNLGADYSSGMLPQQQLVSGANPMSTGYLQQTAPAVTRIFPTAPSMPVAKTDWLGRKT